MYPSSFNTRAIASFIFEAGIETRVCRAATALRIRVSISAMGSVMFMKQHHPITSSTSSRRATHHATLAHGSRCGRDQISEYKREADHKSGSDYAAAPCTWASAATSQSLKLLPYQSPAIS